MNNLANLGVEFLARIAHISQRKAWSRNGGARTEK
jgi:hypothetical protein